MKAYAQLAPTIFSAGHAGVLGDSRPPLMSNELWNLLQRCWAVNPVERPTMAEVLAELIALRAV